MNTIPKHLIDKHKEGVEKLTFYGVPVTELDRDGLLAFANLCAQQLTDIRERFLAFIDTSRVLNEAAKTLPLVARNSTEALSESRIEHLLAIEAAAKKFDEAGTTANQMSEEQWQAYLELKALFHGGIVS